MTRDVVATAVASIITRQPAGRFALPDRPSGDVPTRDTTDGPARVTRSVVERDSV